MIILLIWVLDMIVQGFVATLLNKKIQTVFLFPLNTLASNIAIKPIFAQWIMLSYCYF